MQGAVNFNHVHALATEGGWGETRTLGNEIHAPGFVPLYAVGEVGFGVEGGFLGEVEGPEGEGAVEGGGVVGVGEELGVVDVVWAVEGGGGEEGGDDWVDVDGEAVELR